MSNEKPFKFVDGKWVEVEVGADDPVDHPSVALRELEAEVRQPCCKIRDRCCAHRFSLQCPGCEWCGSINRAEAEDDER